MSELEEAIQKIVDERVKRAIEEEVPDIIRRLTIKSADDVEDLVDATEAARMLGYDLSNEIEIKKSRKKVYDLVTRRLLPAVRLSPHRIRFNPAEVRQLIQNGGNAKRKSA